MATKIAPRITTQIDVRTAARRVETTGKVVLVHGDTDVTFTSVERGLGPIRFTTDTGVSVDMDWTFRDEKTLTEVVQIPEVGQGITMGAGSDSYGGTVWSVSPSGKTFTFTLDAFTARDEHGEPVYTPREPWERTEHGFTETNVKTARWNPIRGRYMAGPYSPISTSGRVTHLDPHF
jgi:hypothetical protein